MNIQLKTPNDVMHEICDRFKSRRLSLNLTQEGLAKRAGMSQSSLKRFERTGQIAFESLLNLAFVLDCLNDFNAIGVPSIHKTDLSLDQILAQKKMVKKRGRIK